MLIEKIFTIYVFFQTLVCGCSTDRRHAGFQVKKPKYSIQKIGKMSKHQVRESSGLELTPDKNNFWTHPDSGNPPELYQINAAGRWLKTQEIAQTSNLDWEDLAKDDNQGYLYIGDFGNNSNKRKDLRIYRLKENDLTQVDTILFLYPDQKHFPPAKTDRNFNCEAFFYSKGYLYLFSKNRGVRDKVKMYRVPAQPGNYTAELIDSIAIASRITAADISPDGQTVALLGYGNLYLFETTGQEKFFAGKRNCLAIPKSGQAEALVFINNRDLVFSNEGGKIFRAVKK